MTSWEKFKCGKAWVPFCTGFWLSVVGGACAAVIIPIQRQEVTEDEYQAVTTYVQTDASLRPMVIKALEDGVLRLYEYHSITEEYNNLDRKQAKRKLEEAAKGIQQ